MKDTLKNSINYTLKFNDSIAAYCNNRYESFISNIKTDSFYATLYSESYIPLIRFKTIMFEYKNKLSDIRQINYFNMSRYCHRIKLSINEAIDKLLYMEKDIEDIQEYLYDIIDFSNEDTIIESVEKYYYEVGPMYEENGNMIIRL